MNIRTLILSTLVVWVVSGVSPAQDSEAPQTQLQESTFQEMVSSAPAQPEPLSVSQAPSPSTTRPEAPRLRRGLPMATSSSRESSPPPSASPKELRIIELRYIKADELSNLIMNVFGIEVHPETRSNRLIVNATEEQMKGILRLTDEMDVPNSEESTSRDVENLVYRIYMFEIPSGDNAMRSFSMILQTSAQVSSKELSVAAADNDFQISEFIQINNGLSEPQTEILIRGKAASDESFKRFFEKFPESHIMELKWDDNETFTDKIAAAQYTQLPEQMQKHIRKFLGDEIRTVGYWFGNSSIPGEVEAPIGPWTMTLRLDTESDSMFELNVEVEVRGEMHRFDRRLGLEQNNEIFSNTIRAKIGKPVIIGYNRESYGARKMGAMVIVPEVDMMQLEGS